jgi:hypothetical protein
MAKLAISAAAATIGYFIGGPTGASIGWQLGNMAGNALLPNDLGKVEGPRLNDLSVLASTYGVGIPVVFGTARTSGNLIWSTGLIESKTTTKSGGKGGGGEQKQTTYTYSSSFAISLGEGPVYAISRIWADGNLIYDPVNGASTVNPTIYLGTESQLPDPLMESHEGVGNVPAYRGQVVVVFETMALGKYGNRIPNLTFEIQAKDGTTTLADVVGGICTRTGLTLADLDTAELTAEVKGYAVPRQMTARTAIETLQVPFFFDGVESDWLLKWPVRGGNPIATLPADDLAARAYGSDPPDIITVTRTQEMELPRELELVYISPEMDYQQSVQRSKRLITQSSETIRLDVPVVMSHTKALQAVEIGHYNAWVERIKYSLQTSYKWAHLDAGDVITVATDTASYQLFITRLGLGPGIVKIDGVANDPAVYGNDNLGTGAEYGQTLPSTDLSTLLLLLDINLLRDVDDGIGYYAAAAGDDPEWPGCQVHESKDGGVNYSYLDSLILPTAIGTASTILADGPTTIWDHGNSVTVNLRPGSGELESTNELNVLNGANGGLLGDEIIQWQTATLNPDGSYTLSNLLRGRRGTEWATATHGPNETFVAFGPESMKRFDGEMASLNQLRHYKGVTIGSALQDTTAQEFTNTGNSQKPYAPVHLKGAWDGSDNLTITWIRRTRVGGEWVDKVDALLGESSEAYEVDIMSGASVIRTISTTTQSASYSSAQQSADGLTPGDPVTARVYQMSQIVGRGYQAQATLTKP